MLDGGEDLDRGGAGNFSVHAFLWNRSPSSAHLTSNYSAEYGLSSAATLTTVLKSGTKTFHASGWEYVRNDALDARNYFNPAPAKVAKLNFNTYGFNVGGQLPFAKSHPTFFFYNMEWRSLSQGGNYNQTVPDPSTYGGNFGATAINVPTAAQGCTRRFSSRIVPAVLLQRELLRAPHSRTTPFLPACWIRTRS